MDEQKLEVVLNNPMNQSEAVLREAWKGDIGESDRRRIQSALHEKPAKRREVVQLEQWLQDESKAARLRNEAAIHKIDQLRERLRWLEKPLYERAWRRVQKWWRRL